MTAGLDDPKGETSSRRFAGMIFWPTLVGLILRLLGTRGDWWLDEIWAYRDAAGLHGWWEALTVLKVDANHPLNAIIQYCFGPTRAVSVLAGTASIVLAGMWANRKCTDNRRPVRVTAWLFALFTPMVVWGSEARGYGTAIFSVLLALVAFDRATSDEPNVSMTRRAGWGAVYGAALIVGMLSHLAFFTFVLAAACWSAVVLVQRLGRVPNAKYVWLRRARWYAALNSVPMVFAAGYWLWFVTQLRYTGGPPMTMATLLAQTAALVVGWPLRQLPWIITFGTVVLFLCVMLVARLRSRKFGDVTLFGVGIFVAPVVMIVARVLTSEAEMHVYPRYFVVSVALVVLLVGETVADGLRRENRFRVVCTGALLFLLLTHLVGDALFLRDGRGQYTAALRSMLATRRVGEVTVLGDHEVRTRMVVDWHARALPPGLGRVVYLNDFNSAAPPQFLIVNLADPEDEVLPRQDVAGVGYHLLGVFRHYGMSGLTWGVYAHESK